MNIRKWYDELEKDIERDLGRVAKECSPKELIAYVSIHKRILDTLNTENRVKILNLVSKKPMNIRKISKEIDISYKSTYLNVQKLAEIGLLKLTKNPKASGQEVLVECVSDNFKDGFRLAVKKQMNE